jgi:hypothetical protein
MSMEKTRAQSDQITEVESHKRTSIASFEKLSPVSCLLDQQALLRLLPDAVPNIIVVLNERRQIVFTNKQLGSFLTGGQRLDEVYGCRPGDVLNCIHACASDGGCGATEFCRMCGISVAMTASLQGQNAVEECRITRSGSLEALDLRIWTTPVTVGGERFSIVIASDISHEKRREALERIFLHDIGNTACALAWRIDALRGGNSRTQAESLDNIRRLCRELTDEIEAQRMLVKAESGELVLQPTSVSALEVLHGAVELYGRHLVSRGRTLRIDKKAQDAVIFTDRALLSRVLGNLLKNALEASKEGQTVTAGCAVRQTQVEFWVHNGGCMPREVQLQVFQRSFSTKGPGRGLGTYSIRLLTEKYLHGTVSFTSLPRKGTTFTVCFPLTDSVCDG